MSKRKKNSAPEVTNELLKEAIADAKAVKESAIESAKDMLTEAFEPRIKDMISRSLEHISEDDMDDEEDEDIVDDAEDEVEDVDDVDDIVPDEDVVDDVEDDLEAIGGDDLGDEEDEEEDEEDVELDEDDEDALGIDAIIRELDDEELDDDDEDEDEDKDLDIEGIELVDEDDELDIELKEFDSLEEDDHDEEDDDDKEELKKELASVKAENDEFVEAVQYLRRKLVETNLLNAKMLHANKLIRHLALSRNQREYVIEAIDRARTVREVKQAYLILAESLKSKGTKIIKKTASEAIRKTKVDENRRILSEGILDKDRIMKLAGIKINK